MLNSAIKNEKESQILNTTDSCTNELMEAAEKKIDLDAFSVAREAFGL